MRAKVKSKGQVKIPKKIQEYLNLHSSDTVDFKISEDGRVYIDIPHHNISDLRGLLENYKQKSPLTTEQMDEIIQKEAQKRANK